MIWRLSGKIWKLWNGFMIESGLLACEGDGCKSHGGGILATPMGEEANTPMQEGDRLSQVCDHAATTSGFSSFS